MRQAEISNKTAVILIASLAVSLYWPTLWFPFYFDDYSEIVNNDALKNMDVGGIWEYHPTRIVVYMSWAVQYRLHQDATFWYRLANILLHFANGVLIFFVFKKTFHFADPRKNEGGDFFHPADAAFYLSILFVCHPLQTESVVYINQRSELLASFFFLAGLLSYIKARVRFAAGEFYVSWYVLSLGIMLAGMFSKEIVFMLPFIITVYDVCFINPGGSLKQRAKFLAPYYMLLPIIPAVIYSYPVIGKIHSWDLVLPTWSYLLTQSRVLWTYLRLALLPVNQNLNHDYPASHTLLDFSTFIAAVSIISVLACAVVLYYKGRRLSSFMLLWFFLLLAPTSSFVSMIETMFEHRLYLALAGVLYLCFILPASRFHSKNSARAATGFLLISVFLLSLLTADRRGAWSDGLALWRDAARKSPRKARPVMNYGIKLSEIGKLEQAEKLIRHSTRLDPAYAKSFFNLAVIYEKKRMYREARENYSEAARLLPELARQDGSLERISYKIGAQYFRERRVGPAMNALKESISANPDFYLSHELLSRIYSRLGEMEKSINEAKTAEGIKRRLGLTEPNP